MTYLYLYCAVLCRKHLQVWKEYTIKLPILTWYTSQCAAGGSKGQAKLLSRDENKIGAAGVEIGAGAEVEVGAGVEVRVSIEGQRS